MNNLVGIIDFSCKNMKKHVKTSDGMGFCMQAYAVQLYVPMKMGICMAIYSFNGNVLK